MNMHACMALTQRTTINELLRAQELEALADRQGEPQRTSGRQETFEAVLNQLL